MPFSTFAGLVLLFFFRLLLNDYIPRILNRPRSFIIRVDKVRRGKMSTEINSFPCLLEARYVQVVGFR